MLGVSELGAVVDRTRPSTTDSLQPCDPVRVALYPLCCLPDGAVAEATKSARPVGR